MNAVICTGEWLHRSAHVERREYKYSPEQNAVRIAPVQAMRDKGRG